MYWKVCTLQFTTDIHLFPSTFLADWVFDSECIAIKDVISYTKYCNVAVTIHYDCQIRQRSACVCV